MIPIKRVSRLWVPVLIIAAIAAGSAVPGLVGSAGASAPDLPPLTPAELLAKARTAQVTGLSGTVELTSNLGLPSLDSLTALGGGGSGTSIAALLSGKHSVQVWIDGTDHARITTVAPLAETNWIRNGTDLWSYDSSTLTTTHATIKAGATDAADAKDATSGVSLPDPAHDTPIQFAQQLLDSVTPSTDVTVDTNARIASRPVYQLVLTPHAAASTVQDVTIAIDAATGLPLDVRITAKSGGTALELGFTDISFDVPSAATFDFTPPPGSKLVEASNPTDLLSVGGDTHRHHHRRDKSPAATTPGDPASALGNTKVLGSDWTSVAVVSGSSVPTQLDAFIGGAQRVPVGTETARLVTTRLFNVLVFDDGRIAIGAVTPDALAATVAAG
jgi:outer membrane lipoprotein-sorting protein